jgi:hypothetical protein
VQVCDTTVIYGETTCEMDVGYVLGGALGGDAMEAGSLAPSLCMLESVWRMTPYQLQTNGTKTGGDEQHCEL